MIFPDQVTLRIATRIDLGGGAYDTVFTNRTVQGIVTFLDSSVVQAFSGSQIFSSRFRIYLSPYGEAIPAKDVTMSWKDFTGLIVEGLIEPHYLRGRLHHYECIARSV